MIALLYQTFVDISRKPILSCLQSLKEQIKQQIDSKHKAEYQNSEVKAMLNYYSRYNRIKAAEQKGLNSLYSLMSMTTLSKLAKDAAISMQMIELYRKQSKAQGKAALFYQEDHQESQQIDGSQSKHKGPQYSNTESNEVNIQTNVSAKLKGIEKEAQANSPNKYYDEFDQMVKFQDKESGFQNQRRPKSPSKDNSREEQERQKNPEMESALSPQDHGHIKSPVMIKSLIDPNSEGKGDQDESRKSPDDEYALSVEQNDDSGSHPSVVIGRLDLSGKFALKQKKSVEQLIQKSIEKTIERLNSIEGNSPQSKQGPEANQIEQKSDFFELEPPYLTNTLQGPQSELCGTAKLEGQDQVSKPQRNLIGQQLSHSQSEPYGINNERSLSGNEEHAQETERLHSHPFENTEDLKELPKSEQIPQQNDEGEEQLDVVDEDFQKLSRNSPITPQYKYFTQFPPTQFLSQINSSNKVEEAPYEHPLQEGSPFKKAVQTNKMTLKQMLKEHAISKSVVAQQSSNKDSPPMPSHSQKKKQSFKKFMQQKELNPRLVTSTILNEQSNIAQMHPQTKMTVVPQKSPIKNLQLESENVEEAVPDKSAVRKSPEKKKNFKKMLNRQIGNQNALRNTQEKAAESPNLESPAIKTCQQERCKNSEAHLAPQRVKNAELLYGFFNDN